MGTNKRKVIYFQINNKNKNGGPAFMDTLTDSINEDGLPIKKRIGGIIIRKDEVSDFKNIDFMFIEEDGTEVKMNADELKALKAQIEINIKLEKKLVEVSQKIRSVRMLVGDLSNDDEGVMALLSLSKKIRENNKKKNFK